MKTGQRKLNNKKKKKKCLSWPVVPKEISTDYNKIWSLHRYIY